MDKNAKAALIAMGTVAVLAAGTITGVALASHDGGQVALVQSAGQQTDAPASATGTDGQDGVSAPTPSTEPTATATTPAPTTQSPTSPAVDAGPASSPDAATSAPATSTTPTPAPTSSGPTGEPTSPKPKTRWTPFESPWPSDLPMPYIYWTPAPDPPTPDSQGYARNVCRTVSYIPCYAGDVTKVDRPGARELHCFERIEGSGVDTPHTCWGIAKAMWPDWTPVEPG